MYRKIVEDPSAPPLSDSGILVTNTPQTTASFTPPVDSIVVAMATGAWSTTSDNTGSMAISSSPSLVWFGPASSNGAGFGCTATKWAVGTGVSTTVTATMTTAGTVNFHYVLAVKVLVGADLVSTGAATATASAGNANVNYSYINSACYGTTGQIGSQAALTLTAATSEIQNVSASTPNCRMCAWSATNLSSAVGNVSLGYTGSGNCFTAVEIAAFPYPDDVYGDQIQSRKQSVLRKNM